jgi:hypothetical protein
MRNDTLVESSPGTLQNSARFFPSSLRFVLSALPGIALIWTQIWLVFAVLSWSIGHNLAPGLIGPAIVGGVLLLPALWASWQIGVWAIASEMELAAEGY